MGIRFCELWAVAIVALAPRLALGEPPAAPAAPAAVEAEPSAPPTREQQSLELRARANAAYVEGRYEDALLLLERANALSPYALHSFNLAAVQHQLGRCELARDLFERYLTVDPEGQAAGDARVALTELYAQCGRAPQSPQSPQSPAVPGLPVAPTQGLLGPPLPAQQLPAQQLPAQQLPAQRSPVQVPAHRVSLVTAHDERLGPRELMGWSALGLGGAAAIAAVTSAILVRRAESDMEAMSRDRGRVWNADEGRALEANGDRYQTLALACGVGSALLTGAGVALLLSDEPRTALGVSLDGDPGLIYSRHF